MTDSLLGTVVNARYRLERAIGAGGMGTVYEALDLHLQRRVAVKALRVGSGASLERFHQEAYATAQLGHPHVVPIVDFIKEPEPYIVMELLDGQSLGARIAREGPLSVPAACFVAVQVLSALEVAHARGIIHRDVKPSNIFLVRSQATGMYAKVLDFGIAKVLDHQGPPITRAGEVLGSAPYMAPEQIRGGQSDARTDIFSMGCVMYEMLAGQRPYKGANTGQIMVAILENAQVPPIANVPPGLMQVIYRAMAHDAFARFATAQHMLDAIAPFAPRVTAASDLPAGVATARPGTRSAHGAREAGTAAPTLAAPPTGGMSPVSTAHLPSQPASAKDVRTAAIPPYQAVPAPPPPYAAAQTAPVNAARQRSPWPWIAGALVVMLAVASVGAVYVYHARTVAVPDVAVLPSNAPVAQVTQESVTSPREPTAKDGVATTDARRGPAMSRNARDAGALNAETLRDAGGLASLDSGLALPDNTRCKADGDCGRFQWCERGHCRCDAEHLLCGGECTRNGPSNCGACGRVCKDDEQCLSRVCVRCSDLPGHYARCGAPSYCMDLDFDRTNCGSCSNRCANRCLMGKCM
jgi:Protein kinase domain